MDKPKSLKYALLFLLLLILLNLAAAVFVMWLALSKEMPQQEPQDNAALIATISKLQGLPARIKKAMPGERDKVTLAEVDVNCLLIAALGKNGLVKESSLPVEKLSVKLKDGLANVRFTKSCGHQTPFGDKLNVQIRMKPEYLEDGTLSVKLLKVKAGRLSIAPWMLQWLVDMKLKKLMASQQARRSNAYSSGRRPPQDNLKSATVQTN